MPHFKSTKMAITATIWTLKRRSMNNRKSWKVSLKSKSEIKRKERNDLLGCNAIDAMQFLRDTIGARRAFACFSSSAAFLHFRTSP